MKTIVEIDPDGDTWIIIPHKPSEGDRKNAPDKSTSQYVEESGQPEQTAVEQQETHFKVSKKHLTLASARARTMFGGPFKEASPVDGVYTWRFEPLFDTMAFRAVMRIIHGQTRHMPQTIKTQLLTDIAVVVDDLQCLDAVAFFTYLWINHLKNTLPESMSTKFTSNEVARWIFISATLYQPGIFRSMTALAIMHCTGPLRHPELPIPPCIVDEVEQRRQDLLEQVISHLHDTLALFLSGKGCPVARCRALMLGTLMQGMHNAGLAPTRPSRPFPGRSLATLLKNCRALQSAPLYFQHGLFVADRDDELEARSTTQIWRLDPKTLDSTKQTSKSPFGIVPGSVSASSNALKEHTCRLRTHIDALVDSDKLKVDGLELKKPT